MKTGSGNGSARNEQLRGRGKSSKGKGKAAIPTMAVLKNVKTITPGAVSQLWTGDEITQIKPAAKPIFEDNAYINTLNLKFSNFQRIPQCFGTDAVLEDPETPFSFLNPEVDPKFASALWLCLAKGTRQYENDIFKIIPGEMNPSGKYCVKIFENNQAIRLIFDDKIPMTADETPKIAILRDKNEKVILPTLLHKAFLKSVKYESFTCAEVITTFTGYPSYEVQLDWSNILFWFGRSGSIVGLYIREEKSEEMGSDRLFHILDVVELDHRRKFIKLQSPGSVWKGRFSGYEEDTKHWTNQIRVLLEIDPETAPTAGYFWMIMEDVLENFDSIMVFSPEDQFSNHLKYQDIWNPKDNQFYSPPPAVLLRVGGPGTIQLYSAPLPTSALENDMQVTFRKFDWRNSGSPIILTEKVSKWVNTPIKIEETRLLVELETNSRGGFLMQMLSNDVSIEFVDYNDIINMTSAEGDLPFFVSMDEYIFNIFAQRFELIGKVKFNLDQPGNVSFAVSITNQNHLLSTAALLFNCDTNDIIVSDQLRSAGVPVTPNSRGYVLLIYGLYNENIFNVQPVDLIGKWRARIFSDVPLSDVVDTYNGTYCEVDGESGELDETHLIQRHVITGGCDSVVVFECSIPISLTLIASEEDEIINEVRGVGFAVLPNVKLPIDKDPTRVIIKSICSEVPETSFQWKLRIFSTAPVVCKEDTLPAERIAAVISGWEKKRNAKQVGKKNDIKSKSSSDLAQLASPVIDETCINTIEGEGIVLSEERIQELLPSPASEAPADKNSDDVADIAEEFKEHVNSLFNKLTEEWDLGEQARQSVSKIYTPPPKTE